MDNRDYLQVLLQKWIILFSCEFGMDTKLTSKKACQPYILDFKLKMRLEESPYWKKKINYFFIFSCAGFSLMRGFSLSRSAWASCCSDLPSCGAEALGLQSLQHVDPGVAAPRL